MKKVVGIFLILAFSVYVLHYYREYRKDAALVESYNQLIQEANRCLQESDWKCAEESTRKLLEQEGNDTVLRNNYATILLELERYEDCVFFVDSIGGRSETLEYLREKALLLQREREGLHLEKSYHFRLEYDGNPSRKNVMEVLSVLEVAYDSLSRLFDFEPENKIKLVLYQSSSHDGVGPRPDWVGAVFDGKLRIPENIMEYSGVYRPMLFHELTHCFLNSMTHTHIPFWINEGIAQIVDGSNRERPSGRAPSLNDLEKPFMKEERRDVAERLYWYSQKMVERMLTRSDSFAYFRMFIQDLNRWGEKDALKKYYSVTAEQLLNEVRE